ncbi:MAG: MlaD family protein [Actinomycetota bacterium]|nr:MlaD family protein [Actinomycetota bacterium]
MNKQAPTLGRLLTMVLFALSCFGLLLFLWLSFGGPVPLKPKGYRFNVAIPEAAQLGLEADVRTAGVRVGKVRVKDVDPKRPNKTIATIELEPRFAPVAKDARAILRQKTLLGETYIELTPGNTRGPTVAEDGFLGDAQVKPTVELDEIFQALDPQTRQAFRSWQADLAQGIRAGRGRDLNDAFGNLAPFAEDASDVLGVLDTHSAAVRQLVRNTGEVFGALTQNESQLRNLITNASDVFDATSSQQEALAETFKIFPTFLDESRLTFTRLESFSRDTHPLVRDLRPAIADLKPALRDVRLFAPDLERLFRNLDPLITVSKKGLPALRDILDGARPLLGQLQPFLEELNPVLEWLEYNQSVVSDFIINGAGAQIDTTATRTEAERGHYLRQYGPTGIETVAMHQNRPAGARGNAYPRPDIFSAGPKHARYMMFANFDCDNTGKGGDGEYLTQHPDRSDIPSCWVQPAPAYPPGNTNKFPHIGRADYSK